MTLHSIIIIIATALIILGFVMFNGSTGSIEKTLLLCVAALVGIIGASLLYRKTKM